MCEGGVDAKILIFDEIGNVYVKKCGPRHCENNAEAIIKTTKNNTEQRCVTPKVVYLLFSVVFCCLAMFIYVLITKPR